MGLYKIIYLYKQDILYRKLFRLLEYPEMTKQQRLLKNSNHENKKTLPFNFYNFCIFLS